MCWSVVGRQATVTAITLLSRKTQWPGWVGSRVKNSRFHLWIMPAHSRPSQAACVPAILTSLPAGCARRTYLRVHTVLWWLSAIQLVLYLATLPCEQPTYLLSSAVEMHAGHGRHASLPQHNKYVSLSHVQSPCQLPTDFASSGTKTSDCISYWDLQWDKINC